MTTPALEFTPRTRAERVPSSPPPPAPAAEPSSAAAGASAGRWDLSEPPLRTRSTQPLSSAMVDPATALGEHLGEQRRITGDANILHLVARDMLRRAWRYREVTGPVVGTFLGVFYVSGAIAGQAGFNLLQPVHAWPFNQNGGDHRTVGGALVATAPAIGLALAVLTTALVERLVRPLAPRGAARPRPTSPISDQLWANITPLSRPAKLQAACILLPTVALGLLPGAITTVAAFNLLDNIKSSPFNRSGVVNRTAGSALLAWGPLLGLVGLVLGATIGVLLGHRVRRLAEG